MHVSDVMRTNRRRRHRQEILNLVETEIQLQVQNRVDLSDVALWRGKNNRYRTKFLSGETWSLTRREKPTMEGYKDIWCSYSTPKYAFLTWLVVKNRVSTGERMVRWNGNATVSCVFCNLPLETRDHLFFLCPFSLEVWEELVGGLLLDKFSASWAEILDRTTTFLLRYVFQNTMHSIWNERNDRRHGEQPTPANKLVQWIDKNVRNRLNTIRGGGDLKYTEGFQIWTASIIHGR